ncbi:MAG: hypothetical protein KA791_15160 [Flavobacteriales bacterium]|nr:hypothetical protein [Flavobacteriales bacterium]
MKLHDKNILIISNEAWGDVWFSKHNYAYELARNNRVTFVDPPGPWRPQNLLGSAPKITHVKGDLSVLRYRNRLPVLNKWFYRLNEWLITRSIERCLQRNGSPTDALITFDPTRFTTPQRLHPGVSIFLCVDKYTFGFHGERDLCRNVDAIITISEHLSVRYEHFQKPLLTIGHSISRDEFHADPPTDLPAGYGLYVGTIDARVDHAHVREMLERFPQMPFVFVGRLALKEDDPDREIYLPGRYPNVYYVGVKPFKELKTFIAGSRFCLAPMDLGFPGNDISHHKTFQYLALGKPVFSTVFSEYLPIRDLMYMENDRSRSIERLHEFLEKGEPEHLAAQRIAHARSMTYERTFERIEHFLETVPHRDMTAPGTTARSIFLFSNEPWGDMWYSKHHYAAELAKHHEVYFVNMPRRWGLSSLFSWRARTRLTPEGVHVVDYTNTLPRRLGEFVGRWSGRKVMRLRPHAKAVCWSFNPLALQECLAMRAGGATLIYHTVDPYQAFPEDAIMARSADLMVCVNKWFFDYYERYNPHRVLVPHGVRREDREFEAGAVERLRSEHGRFALLAASLTEYANFPLLTAVAQHFPGTRLLVVGSKFPLSADAGMECDEFLALPNVIYLGVRHPDELRNLARAAAVGLLAYDFEVRRSVPISGGRTPLKVLTYLAQHCPLVTTNNSYIPELEDKGCFKADTAEGFLRIMAEVLEGRLTVDGDAVDRYMNEVTYEKLVERVFRALDEPRS